MADEKKPEPTEAPLVDIARNSVAIKRLIAEVAAAKADDPSAYTSYNRVYSRHNRS